MAASSPSDLTTSLEPSTTITTTTTSSPPPPPSSTDRLSMPLPIRVPTACLAAFLAGSLLGSSHGGKMAALRFRAENAHRLPTSSVGWYLYHKSKNYHVMLGGLREGVKKGAMMAAWVGLFFTIEEAVDRFRDGVAGGGGGGGGKGSWVGRSRDAGSTVVAGLGTAGAWSLWNRFPPVTAARTAKLGLAVGLGFGLLQDALSLARGRHVGYVDFLKRLSSKTWNSRVDSKDAHR